MKKTLLILSILACLFACDDFFEVDISDDNVVVVGPGDGVSVATGDVAFVWRPLEHATAYHITVVSPGFGEAASVAADTILRNDTLRMHSRFVRHLEPGDYQWSIRASNSVYSTREQVFSLTVVPLPEPENPGGEDPGETPEP